jgi:hypothetical protein
MVICERETVRCEVEMMRFEVGTIRFMEKQCSTNTKWSATAQTHALESRNGAF